MIRLLFHYAFVDICLSIYQLPTTGQSKLIFRNNPDAAIYQVTYQDIYQVITVTGTPLHSASVFLPRDSATMIISRMPKGSAVTAGIPLTAKIPASR